MEIQVNLQTDPNENLPAWLVFQDPTLVKPGCGWDEALYNETTVVHEYILRTAAKSHTSNDTMRIGIADTYHVMSWGVHVRSRIEEQGYPSYKWAEGESAQQSSDDAESAAGQRGWEELHAARPR